MNVRKIGNRNEVIALQEQWKKIGYSDNNEEVWNVFRNACDVFFQNKRGFYDGLDSKREDNRILKESLIQKAEAVKDSTEWKRTTDLLIGLQKEWKGVGPAQRGVENKLWERFRGACDAFFEGKKAFFADKDAQQEENLSAKEALIKEIEAFELTEDVPTDFESLKKFSEAFAAIGFVPLKDKDRIYEAYKTALDSKYDQLKVNREELRTMRFQSRINELSNSVEGADDAIKREKTGINRKLDRIKEDIAQYENNLGFFKNPDHPIRKEVESKIAKLRRDADDLRKQIHMLNQTAAKANAEAEAPAEGEGDAALETADSSTADAPPVADSENNDNTEA